MSWGKKARGREMAAEQKGRIKGLVGNLEPRDTVEDPAVCKRYSGLERMKTEVVIDGRAGDAGKSAGRNAGDLEIRAAAGHGAVVGEECGNNRAGNVNAVERYGNAGGNGRGIVDVIANVEACVGRNNRVFRES